MAKSKRNDYQVVRKPLPSVRDDIIKISNITVSKKGISGIMKVISDVLSDDKVYTAELTVKELR